MEAHNISRNNLTDSSGLKNIDKKKIIIDKTVGKCIK